MLFYPVTIAQLSGQKNIYLYLSPGSFCWWQAPIRGQYPGHVITPSQSEASIQVTWSLPANQRRAVCWWQEPVAVSGPSGCFLQFLFSIFFLFSKCLPGIFWSIFFQDNSPRNCKDFYENIFVIIKATVFPLVSQSFCLIMVSLV